MKINQDVQEQLNRSGLYAGPDGQVKWHDDAPEHPKNWPVRRKLFDTGVITLFVTVSWVLHFGGLTDTAC